MGLLDDAIREHLELKRLRGADPGEVAREERDALGPVERSRESAQDHESDHDVDADGDDDFADDEDELPRDRSGATDHDIPSPGEETAELDMQLMMDSEPAHPIRAARSQTHEDDAPNGSTVDDDSGEESIDWEMPD